VDTRDEAFVARLATFLNVDQAWIEHVLAAELTCGCYFHDGVSFWCETYELISDVASAERNLKVAQRRLSDYLDRRAAEEIEKADGLLTANRPEGS